MKNKFLLHYAKARHANKKKKKKESTEGRKEGITELIHKGKMNAFWRWKVAQLIYKMNYKIQSINKRKKKDQTMREK